MSTNFYIRENLCKHCDRYEERHIGKSSKGWDFHFRGYSSLGLTSCQEWAKYLLHKEIYDEYGNQVSYGDFFTIVFERYNKDGTPKLNAYEWDKEYSKDYGFQRKVWKDRLGYAIEEGEFS